MTDKRKIIRGSGGRPSPPPPRQPTRTPEPRIIFLLSVMPELAPYQCRQK